MSVCVPVMDIGRVLVLVLQPVVVVRMRVLAAERRIMCVRVMVIGVAVDVIVIDRLVDVTVAVALAQM